MRLQWRLRIETNPTRFSDNVQGSDFNVAGAYLVIEGPHAAGGTWQLQLIVTSVGSSGDMSHRFAFRGGWENANEFDNASYTVSNTCLVWYANVSASGTLEMFASNDQTFGRSPGTEDQALTSFMFRVQDSSGLDRYGVLCGGFYRPVRQDGLGSDPDTHPCGVLSGLNKWGNGSTSYTWGYGLTNTSYSHNRAGAENTHTSATPSLACLAGMPSYFQDSSTTTHHADRDGNYLTQNLVFGYNPNSYAPGGILGEVCPEILVGIDKNADNDGTTSGGYQKFECLLFRKPS